MNGCLEWTLDFVPIYLPYTPDISTTYPYGIRCAYGLHARVTTKRQFQLPVHPRFFPNHRSLFPRQRPQSFTSSPQNLSPAFPPTSPQPSLVTPSQPPIASPNSPVLQSLSRVPPACSPVFPLLRPPCFASGFVPPCLGTDQT